jgi:hypothetical protein
MVESSKISVLVLNEINPIEQVIDGFEFHTGEDRVLKCQLWHEANEGAYILAAGATVKFMLPLKSGFILNIPGAIDGVNRSIVSVVLTRDETNILKSGDIVIEINESGSIRYAKQRPGETGIKLL